MALAADGKIFTWGDAKFGQLGHQQLVALVQVGCGRQVVVHEQSLASLSMATLCIARILGPRQLVTCMVWDGIC